MAEHEEKQETEVKPTRPGILSQDKEIAFRPKNFEELWGFAKIVADTDFVPTSDKGKPGQVLAKIQYGHEVGLPPMQSLRFIVTINGIPSIWGDGYWMLVKHHPLCEWTDEFTPEEALAKGYGQCTIMRRGDPKPTTRTFSIEEAKKADLWDKKDNWRKYPGLMLGWRARHRCGSAAIPEASGGLVPSEVAYDYETTATEVKDEPLKIPQSTEAPEGKTNESEPNPDQLGTAEAGGEVASQDSKRRDTSEDDKKKPLPPEDQIAQWIETAPAEEILSNKNFITANLGRVAKEKQVGLATKFNQRRKDVLLAKKEAEKGE